MAIPFAFDQTSFGESLHQLGVGPPPFLHSDLTVSALENCINLMRNPATATAMRDKARRLASHLEAENGAVRAADFVLERLHVR